MTNRVYDFNLAAAIGANQRLDAAGTYVKVMSAPGGPVGVKLDGGAEIELSAGQAWRVPAGKDFREVVLRNLQAVANAGRVYIGTNALEETVTRRPPVLVMQTGVGQVPGGAAAGWVNGTPANLAASGLVYCLFDLGPDWDQYDTLQLSVRAHAPSSGFSGITASGRDDPVANQNTARFMRETASNGFNILFASLTTANGYAVAILRPSGRYVVVGLTNADAANAMGPAASVALTAYPS